MDFLGTSGRDNYLGTTLADEFDMSQGAAHGLGAGGRRRLLFGGELNATTRSRRSGCRQAGSEGTTWGCRLHRDTAVNLERIELRPGFNYSLTWMMRPRPGSRGRRRALLGASEPWSRRLGRDHLAARRRERRGDDILPAAKPEPLVPR